VNPASIDRLLADRYDADTGERRAVVRAAVDLADDGRYGRTHDVELTVERIGTELAQAPEDLGLAECWNWWIGSLELAHGDYDRFRVRRWEPE